MAVNDLMMRIQLLTDTGKSTGELKRLSTQINALVSQVKSLDRLSLVPLTSDLRTIKTAQDTLKATNLQTFATTLNTVKQSLSGLKVNTQGIDLLAQSYLNLQQQLTKVSLATQQYRINSQRLDEQLKSAKKHTLTATDQSRNNALLNAQTDIDRYTKGIRLAETAARRHRQTILELKNALVAASVVQVDPTKNVDLVKLRAWANASDRGVRPVADPKAFSSLQAFTDELGKQQAALALTKAKARSYQETLAQLRLESQRAAIPDLMPNGRNLIGDLENVRSKIALLTTQSIVPLTAKINELRALSNLDRAFNVDPLRAKIAVARAEIQKWALDLRKAVITGNESESLSLQNKIATNKQKIADLSLEAANSNLKIIEGATKLAAIETKALVNKKNEVAGYKDQVTAIQSIIDAQKRLAQQKLQAINTKAGGILDTKALQNANQSAANVYQANLAALKNYHAERKAAAQSDAAAIQRNLIAVQQQLAQGQLTKAQYLAERNAIKEIVSEQKKLSSAYQQTLRDQKAALTLSLSAEKANAASLKNQVKDLTLLNAEIARSKAVDLRGKLTTSQGAQASLKQQIQETQALAEAELKRISILDRMANASKKTSSLLSIRGTEDLIRETVKRLAELGAQSDQVKTRLATLGASSSLPKINAQIKSVRNELAELRSIGIPSLAPSQALQFGNLQAQLKGLREQQQLMRQLSGIDVKTLSSKVELGDLNKQLTQLRQLRNEMNQLNQIAKGFGRGFGFSLTPEQLGFSAFQVIFSAFDTLKDKFIQVNSQSETLIRGLEAVFGRGQGEVQFSKLTDLANTYGLSLHDLSRNYLSLNASAKGTVLEGKESEKIFKSLSAAMAVLGADTVSTQRAFRAVSQMISKGQVYSEELKGQLAESLPGAVNLFARSMGKTTQDFLMMVKAGQVGLNQLVTFFDLVQKEYGSAATSSTTYEQATNRLSNAYMLLLKNIGDTGVWKKLVYFIDEAGRGLDLWAKKLANSPVNEITELLNQQIKPIELLTDEQFNRLKSAAKLNKIEIPVVAKFDTFDDYMKDLKAKFDAMPKVKLGAETLTITSIGSFADFDAYIAKTRQLKGETEAYNLTLQKSAMAKQLLVDKQNMAELEAQIAAIKNMRSELITLDQYRKNLKNQGAFYTRMPDSTFNIVSLKLYQQSLDKIQAAERKLYESKPGYKNGLLDVLAAMKASVSASEQSVASSAKQSAFNNKLLRDEQNLLNVRQQSYSALSAVQNFITQRNLKGSGVNDALIAEQLSVNKLTDSYTQLLKAKSIESTIKVNSVHSEDNTSSEDQAALRKLVVDQLKHAQTVAQGANNLSLQLLIMNELNRVQTELTGKNRDNTAQLALAGDASAAVLDKTKLFATSLSTASSQGYALARSIFSGLAYAEKMNQLQEQQNILLAKTQQIRLNESIDYEDKVHQAEEVAKAIKKSQDESGNYFSPEKKAADREAFKQRKFFSEAEAKFDQAKKERNQELKGQLIEITREYLKQAMTSATQAGDTYGLKKIRDFNVELDQYNDKINAASVTAQQAQLSDVFKMDNGVFDANKSFDAFSVKYNELLRLRQKALQAANDPNISKRDMEEWNLQADNATQQIIALNALFPQLKQAAEASGQAVKWTLLPLPKEVLDSERLRLDSIMSQPVKTSLQLDVSEATAQNNAFVVELTKPLTKIVNVRYVESGRSGASDHSSVQGFARGGVLSGYGGGDRIRALLEPGEAVLRKEAVRQLGAHWINAINQRSGAQIPKQPRAIDRLHIPGLGSVQHFSGGGIVQNQQPIVINVAGGKSIHVSGSRDQAQSLANLLTRTGRAL